MDVSRKYFQAPSGRNRRYFKDFQAEGCELFWEDLLLENSDFLGKCFQGPTNRKSNIFKKKSFKDIWSKIADFSRILKSRLKLWIFMFKKIILRYFTIFFKKKGTFWLKIVDFSRIFSPNFCLPVDLEKIKKLWIYGPYGPSNWN